MFGFSKRFSEVKKLDLCSMFPVRFFVGEGAAGGDGDGDGGESVATADRPEFDRSDEVGSGGIPKEFADRAMDGDPELQEMRDKKNADRAVRNKAAKTPKQKPQEEKHDEPIAEDIEENAGTPAEKGEASETTDDEFETIEFKDDIIPGLKGESLKQIGKESAEAIANFYEKATADGTRLSEIEAANRKLLSDPVIKARAEMIESGRDYSVRQITQEEQAAARNLVVTALKNKYSLLDEEAAGAFDEMWNILKPGFDKIAKDSAQDMLHQGIQITSAKQQENDTFSDSMKIFLSLGQYNKDLIFKETDPSKLFTYKGKGVFEVNDSHPEAAKAHKKLIPVMDALGKAGFTYQQIKKMAEDFGPDAVYSLAAKKLNLPVAINASGIINEATRKAVSKALNAFRKGSANDGLPVDGSSGSAVSNEKKGKGNVENGIDLDRVDIDDEYFDEMMDRKRGDRKWMTLVQETRDKAARLRRNKGKPKK